MMNAGFNRQVEITQVGDTANRAAADGPISKVAIPIGNLP
jgi:hypothetical protein